MSKRGAYLHSLRETFDCAFRVLTSERFKKMEGLGNEVPFFVLRYKPEWEPTVDEELSRLRRRLREERYRLADVERVCARRGHVEGIAVLRSDAGDGRRVASGDLPECPARGDRRRRFARARYQEGRGRGRGRG